MPLTESTWRKTGEIDEIGSTFPTFCQFFPNEKLIITIIPTHKDKCHYLVSGFKYSELGNGRVLILFSPDSPWEDSYTLNNDHLIWETHQGTRTEYTRASEDDIPPATLKYRDLRRREFAESNQLK